MSEKDVLRKPVISRPAHWDEVSSFVCYYGDFKEEMALFDVAILEPSKIPPDKITWLRSHGTYTIAYISVGEDSELKRGDGQGPGGYASYYVDRDGKPAQNGNWGSYFVDAGNPAWQEIIIEKAGQILEMGCDGLFLDTIDTAEIYPSTRGGMASLIGRLKETYPEAKIVANRGMFMLKDFAPHISGLMFEDFTNGYDFVKQTYKPHTQKDLRWTKNEADKINAVRREHYFPVFALDYADPEDTPTIQACYDRAWGFDFIPAVSVIRLDRVLLHDVKPSGLE